MDRQTRIAYLIDHFKHPRHKGRLDPADARMPGGNPGCGDLVTMHVRAAPEENRIEEVSFEGEGCTISQAAASILVQRMNRKRPTFEEIADLTYEEMIDLLGQDIVGSRPRCATLALGTLKAAVKRIEMDRMLKAAGRTEQEIQRMRELVAAQAAGTGLVFGEAAYDAAKAGQSRLPDPLAGSG
jgi:nitrogen fixation NifU-like protein